MTQAKKSWDLRRRRFLKFLLALPAMATSFLRGEEKPECRTLYVVPNMHDCVAGWLAPYHVERNYSLDTYLEHHDLAMRDPNYKYIVSEIPNLITMMEWESAKFEELKGLIAQDRVELVNAFVLEATINTAGGEALVKSGVDGLCWYAEVMNARPRYAYMIDVIAWHEQMAQIVGGLGLDVFIYCRYNPTDEIPEDRAVVTGGDALHWIESPDGTRALAVNPGHYTGPLQNLWKSETVISADVVRQEMQKIVDVQRKRWGRFPQDAPLMTFTGRGDYMRAPLYKGYPAEALKIWEDSHPDTRVVMATLKDWSDAAKPQIDAGKYDMQVVKTGSKIYGWTADYVNAPRSKQWYRRAEHALQATEALNTIASLQSPLIYPSQDLSNEWFLMALLMCRDPLWGAAVSGVFEREKGWDVRDRYELVDAITGGATRKALPALLGEGEDRIGPFNPSSWEREGLLELELPPGKGVKEAVAQLSEDEKITLVSARLPSFGVKTLALESGVASTGKTEELPGVIETDIYSAKVDAHEAPWEQARIPEQAWDYNAPPLVGVGVGEHEEKSYVETSGNVLMEALRRVGDDIEMRMVECQGASGEARVKVNLPHAGAALTNLLGENPKPLQAASATQTGGAEYRFDIRPQQIVTLRLKTREAVAPIQALRTTASLIPEHKRQYTLTYRHRDLVGEPPGRGVPVWLKYE